MSILQLATKYTPLGNTTGPLELNPLPGRGSDEGLWIDPVTLIRELNGWELAREAWAIQTSHQLQFWVLPKPSGPGAPPTYRDESVLLTSLVAAAWRLSYERITDWLARYTCCTPQCSVTLWPRCWDMIASISRGTDARLVWRNTRVGCETWACCRIS